MNTVKYLQKLFCLALILECLTISTYHSQNKHPYASDQPMTTPKKFDIPGVRSAWHITFEPDGKTFYFVTGDSMEVIYYSHFENGKWSTPKKTAFSGKYRIETPSVSPDGKKFYFAKAMVRDNQGIDDIYVMDKTETGWSEPKELDSPINTDYFDASPSCAANGNMYFFSNRDGRIQIYHSKFVNGKYTTPEALDDINRVNPGELCIAPDESYILFNASSYPNSNHLFVSFNNNGSWSMPRNLGPKINFNDYQGRPCISPDGNYLFYTSGSSRDWVMSQYQVDIKPLLDSLRNIYEVNAVTGRDKKIESPTFINIKDKSAKIKFQNTPAWLTPYVKKTGKEQMVMNKINIEGLKAGVYNAYVKLTSENSPVKEYGYSITLNLLEVLPSVQVKDLKNGLRYEYYEDTAFTVIPNFSKMKPIKAGIADQVDLSVKNRDTLYAITYNGFINIPQTAVYTLYLSSDDGSKLYVNNKLFFDNDGLHGPVEKSNNYCLEKGFHKIKVEFMQGRMGAALDFSYESRDLGIKKKTFSREELFHQ